MKLPINLRCLEVALIGLLCVTAVHGQEAQSATQSDTQMIAARISAGPLDSSATSGSNLAEAAMALPSPTILPLTPQPILRPATRHSEGGPSARELKVWKGLLIAEHSAAIFDAWTTRESLQSGNGYERNPLIKPFANSAAVYPVLQLAPVGFDFLSHRMMRSQNRIIRKTWWLPQVVSTGASLWCGARNLRVADLKR